MGTGSDATRAGRSAVGSRRKKILQPALLLLALAVTACVVAWGYLVYAAVGLRHVSPWR